MSSLVDDDDEEEEGEEEGEEGQLRAIWLKRGRGKQAIRVESSGPSKGGVAPPADLWSKGRTGRYMALCCWEQYTVTYLTSPRSKGNPCYSQLAGKVT